MKPYILFFLVAASTFWGCDQGKVKELEEENQRLNEAVSRQDSVLNDFLESFNNIEDNLALIREKENLIALSSRDPEMQATQKDRILEDIQLINNLLDENKEIINNLNSKLSRSDVRINEFNRMVARLNRQIEEKDSSIVYLKDQLASKDFAIGELNQKLDSLSVSTIQQTARLKEQAQLLEEKSQRIASQQEKLNTAYFVVGSAKELIALDVLDKSGLFGGKKSMSDDLSKDVFNQIDITETYSIPVNSKKVDLMSSHPVDSYVLNENEGNIETLEITDPDNFWKNTRYLIVVTK